MLEFLRNEHRAIERLLRILNTAVRKKGDLSPQPELLVRAVEMLQTYAEDYHQELEENELFPRLEKEGVPYKGGPLEVLAAEHRLAKQYVVDMRSALNRWMLGEENAWSELTETIHAYSMLLRAHIGKEDMVILPMAHLAFQGERAEELNKEIEKVRLRQVIAVDWGEYERILTELEEELGLASEKVSEEADVADTERLAEAFIKREP